MFDQLVQPRRSSRGKSLLITGSLVAHGLAAVGLVVWSFFTVEEVTPPTAAVVMVSLMPPPAPAISLGSRDGSLRVKRPSTKPPTKSLTQPSLTQPRVSDPTPAASEPADTAASEQPYGDEHGDPNGRSDGQLGGDPGATGPGCVGCTGTAPVPTPPPAIKPHNVPPHQLDAQVIYHPDPSLPDVVKLQHKGESLSYTARVCIDQSGGVSDVHVIAGIPNADSAIERTIREWRYRPQPIPVCFVANWVFSID